MGLCLILRMRKWTMSQFQNVFVQFLQMTMMNSNKPSHLLLLVQTMELTYIHLLLHLWKKNCLLLNYMYIIYYHGYAIVTCNMTLYISQWYNQIIITKSYAASGL